MSSTGVNVVNEGFIYTILGVIICLLPARCWKPESPPMQRSERGRCSWAVWCLKVGARHFGPPRSCGSVRRSVRVLRRLEWRIGAGSDEFDRGGVLRNSPCPWPCWPELWGSLMGRAAIPARLGARSVHLDDSSTHGGLALESPPGAGSRAVPRRPRLPILRAWRAFLNDRCGGRYATSRSRLIWGRMTERYFEELLIYASAVNG